VTHPEEDKERTSKRKYEAKKIFPQKLTISRTVLTSKLWQPTGELTTQ